MSCNKTASTSKKPQSCFHQLQDWRDVQGVIKTVFQVKPFGIPLGLWGAAVPMALEMGRCWKDGKVECTKKHQSREREIYIYNDVYIYIFIYQDFNQKHPRMSECQALCDVAHAQSHAVREAWMLWISGLFF